MLNVMLIQVMIGMVPDFETIMLPLLEFTADQNEHTRKEAINAIVERFNLSDEERRQILPSGQPKIDNRVGWALTYLKKAGLIESTKRGYFRITPLGIDVLSRQPERIDVEFLEQFPEFREFKSSRRKDEKSIMSVTPSTDTPEELLDYAYQQLQEGLAAELLSMVKQCSPEFFERLVIDVLVKMGYGGTRQDAGQAIGRTGDEGIDGIIKEDRLGLDYVYIQAKRWDGVVGRPEIQKFVGALQGRYARKGIFITTGRFSEEAYNFVDRIDSRIVLIDGTKLVELMIDNDVGVNTVRTVQVKKIDHDYFSED